MIEDISDFVTRNTSERNAEKYIDELLGEIWQLSILAESVRESRFYVARECHPHAKMITTRKKKFSIIFHIDGDYVCVDKIIASSMVTH